MDWTQLPLGPLQTNCYILSHESKCIVFDPGSEGDQLVSWLKENKLDPLAVLLTHAHFDHIGAVRPLKEAFNMPVYLHEKEAEWLENADLNGSSRFGMGSITAPPADVLIRNEEDLTIDLFTFKLLHTPGHSPGSVSYYFEEGGALFAGDTLFMGSIGRTDLAGGDHQTLLTSIHEKIMSLPEETIVLPGHGPATSVITEMDSNPFLNGF
ncbi:MBL fold metallo-hydrolase [Domibacillus sp. 8LH]|uniref:MBL fold metallo-hydrolase n=1 Tax=Domibacillus TaxID=1433999 RepID=UPI00203F457D|nr:MULTISPECIES: MBL fold metallo-hydrolase [Domibacillus]MCM3788421.1 MBL fold metallo-hydrolase [Domibacillus indicus]